jgi:hypothetical protein
MMILNSQWMTSVQYIGQRVKLFVQKVTSAAYRKKFKTQRVTSAATYVGSINEELVN